MKEIDSQLYGYSYELDTTSESNGTKCFAVDTGTVFVAYKGVWYEQPGSFWAASISEGEDDLFGTSWEIGKIIPDDDLVVLNAVDTGKRYVSFNGKWYEQPVAWSAPAPAGAGLGDEAFIVTLTPTAQDFSGTMDKTPQEIYNAYKANRQIRAKILGIYSDEYTDLWAFMTSAVLREYTIPTGSYVEVRFEFVLEYGENTFFVQAETNGSGNNVYRTKVFPLTPMS